MTIGEFLLSMAAVTALLGLVSSTLQARVPSWGRISRWGCYLSFVILTASLLLLSFQFVTSDMSNNYVWSHSDTSLPVIYKLAAVWAGGQGGILLWVWFMALALTVEVLLEGRRGLGPRFHQVFRTVAMAFIFVFTLVLLVAGLFSPTEPSNLMLSPNGAGMNISLQSPEMIIHPPVVFASYAFCMILFASSIAKLVVPGEPWRAQVLPWSRLTLLLLTIGIAVGGVWAFYELGWGGFWVWDPVETASLLPWLTVVAFLHTLLKPRLYPVFAPVLGALSFVAVLFSAFLTRTGGLWGSSVHTYGSSIDGSMALRLWTVLTSDKGVAGFFVLMVASLLMVVLLAYRQWKIFPHQGSSRPNGPWSMMDATVGLFLFMTTLLITLLVKNTGLGQGENFMEFTEKVGLLSVVLISSLTVCVGIGRAGVKRTVAIVGAVAGVGILLAIIGAATSSYSWLLALILPPYLLAMLVVIWKALSHRGDRKYLMRRAGAALIHLAVLLVAVGFLVSTILVTLPSPSPQVPMVEGGATSLGHYDIKVISVSTSQAGSDKAILCTAVLEIYEGDSLVELVSLQNEYSSDGLIVLRSSTYVHKALTDDLYISFSWMGGKSILLSPRIIPMTNLVWGGAAMLPIGIVIRAAGYRSFTAEVEGEQTVQTADNS